jgi:hypothetical protein
MPPSPTISFISPSSGSNLGGTTVTITGTSFTSPTVTINGVSASVLSSSSTSISIITPQAGTSPSDLNATLIVYNVGVFASNSVNFTYTDGLTISSISPTHGLKSGGYTMNIFGIFNPNDIVTIGTNRATIVTDTRTLIEVNVPAVTSAGVVLVSVTDTYGNTSNMISFVYSDPACYDEHTLMLTTSGYKEIKDLIINDEIIIYNEEPKKIKHIAKFVVHNNPNNNKECMFVLKKDKNAYLLKDLYILGGHSILVDKLPKKAYKSRMKSRRINDKYLLLCSEDHKFDKIIDDVIYNCYQLVLENDNIEEQFGIFANGILSESMSENVYNRIMSIS